MPYDNTGILALQRAWLDKLQVISKKPITVKAIAGATPDKCQEPALYQWTFFKDIWPQIKAPIWTRRILDNEVVFDADVKNWQTLREEMNKIILFCRDNHIPFYLAYTGGDGVHLSLYMKPVELDDRLLKKAYEKDLDITKIIRQTAINHLLETSKASTKKLALDTKKYNFSKMRSGSQLREYGTLRENGGFKTLIEEIPLNKPDAASLVLRFPDKIELWDISFISGKIDTAIKEEIERAERDNEANLEPIDLTDCKVISFPCIKTLIEKGRTSARYYGGQSIALMMRKCGYTWESSESIVLKYFKRCTGLTKDGIEKRLADVKNTVTEYEYGFSCREFKEIFGEGYCQFRKCPLSDKTKRTTDAADRSHGKTVADNETQGGNDAVSLEANRIMEEGDPIRFIIDAWNRFHTGDSPFGYVLLCSAVCGSVEASDGLPINFNGDSGGGKSHACRSMLHLIPKKMWIRRSLSNKALFYSASIQPGMIFFSDDVEMSEEMRTIFKNSVSDFQEQIEHETVDIHRQSQILRAPPRLTWWLTAVTDIGDAQMERRCLKIAIDLTEERKKAIAERFLARKKMGEQKYPEHQDVMVCREIFKELRSRKEKVIFDFDISFRQDADINTQSIVYELLCATALINKHQRQRTPEGAVIAERKDFQLAVDMFSKISDTQVTKLTKNELLVARFLHQEKLASSNTIQTSLKKSKAWVSYILNGRGGKAGLLSKMSQIVEDDISVREDTETTRKKEYRFVGEWDPLAIYDKIAMVKE